MKKEEIMVSICCITYNHEKYIKEALDSFLMQKTNFKYEIIIHDDASTDNTANIIKEYEAKYPDIIKPIYQKENQYSKGIKASLITYQKAQGKYIAVCEGDDYWIDANKLQMQVEYMEKNPECTLCFHNASIFNMQNEKQRVWIKHNRKFYKKNGNYNAGELDLLGFIPTASYLFRKQYVEKIPNWFNKCAVGDRPLKLIITNFGYAHYIDRVMSVYRIGTKNSMMDQINNRNKDVQKAIEYWDKIHWIVDQFNSFSEFKYSNELKLAKNEIEKNKLIAQNNYKQVIKNKQYRMWMGKREKIKLFLKVYMRPIYNLLKKMRNKNGKK